MADPRDEFWGKKAELEKVTKQVAEKIHYIEKAYNAFFSFGYSSHNRASGEPWQWVTILNKGNALPGFPTHVVRTNIMLDAKYWPTLEEVGSLLGEWHRIDDEYRAAWEALPENQKEQMQEHRPPKRMAPEQKSDQSRRY
jgi:hypothetical protein